MRYARRARLTQTAMQRPMATAKLESQKPRPRLMTRKRTSMETAATQVSRLQAQLPLQRSRHPS